MRWVRPEHGDIRVRRMFAFFPMTIGRETRWLEWVRCKERYEESYDSGWRVWRVLAWVDDE